MILVGWGGPQGAGDLNYQKSASTTRTIGAHVGEVVQNLIENGNGDPDRFHILGHRLLHYNMDIYLYIHDYYKLIVHVLKGTMPW